MTISGVLKGFNNTVIYFAEEHSYKEINNVFLIFSYGSRSRTAHPVPFTPKRCLCEV